MSGKGSGRRPAQVNEQAFSDSWDSIFGKCEKLPQDKEPVLSSFSGPQFVGLGKTISKDEAIQIYADNPIYNGDPEDYL